MFWTDAWKAGAALWKTGFAVQETAVAALFVVGHRKGTIEAALRNPLEADVAELGLMVPEKVAAFTKAGMSLVEDWMALQADLLAQGQDIATITMGGAGGPAMRRAIERAPRIAAKAGAAAGRAVAPIHAAATANRRRLAKAKPAGTRKR